MDASSQALVLQSAAGSLRGELHFGQVVGLLQQAGVESYHVDYRSGCSTYHWPDGRCFTLQGDGPEQAVAPAFDAAALQAAIRGAQAGRVRYPEFKRLSQAAGCAAYTVWISGRHVSYQGRRGETHVEPFPD